MRETATPAVELLTGFVVGRVYSGIVCVPTSSDRWGGVRDDVESLSRGTDLWP